MKITTLAVIAGSVLLLSLPMAGQEKLSPADKKFMTMGADINMTEANLGKMAEDHASEQSVKAFGQTLTQDHSKAYGELLGVADSTHEQIPRGIDIRKNSEYQQLSHMKGASFDRQFLQHEIRDHEKALAEFKREAEHGENTEVKNYANQQVPVLEKHLHDAQDLAKSAKQRS
jgi:putative membrane protein